MESRKSKITPFSELSTGKTCATKSLGTSLQVKGKMTAPDLIASRKKIPGSQLMTVNALESSAKT